MNKEIYNKIMDIFDNKENFEKLVKDFKHGNVVPFLGAGFSRPQFPGWKDFIEDNAVKYGIDEKIKKIEKKNMEVAASCLVDKMGKRNFKDYFIRTFDKEIDTYTQNQQMLPKLFKETIITTNYDHLVESLYETQEDIKLDVLLPRHEMDHAAVDRIMQHGNSTLIKLHGDASRYESCIFTEEDYQEIYTGSSEYEKILSRLFENKIMLFLGCSLESDRTLSFLKELSHNRDIVHYAIVPLPKITENSKQPFLPLLYEQDAPKTLKREFLERNQQLSNYDIRPIYYPYEKYESIAAILEELSQSSFFLG